MKLELLAVVEHIDSLPEYHPGREAGEKIELLDVVRSI